MPPPLSLFGWRAYLAWTFATCLFVTGLVGGFNAFVDPLGVTGAPRLPHFNAIKPSLGHTEELSRWKMARRVCATSGIFGNSRAEIGFDPETPAFQAKGWSVFNHAIPGAGPSTALRQLTWLQEAGCMPKTIILGVDFFDFIGDAPAGKLPKYAAPEINKRFLTESLFSITGLRDSFRTVMVQFERYPATITERGFNPLNNYVPEVRQAGHYSLFRQKAAENLRTWLHKISSPPKGDGRQSSSEQSVDAFLLRATSTGSEVHLVIYPYHAEIRLILERIGLGPAFEDWKRHLVATAENNSRAGATVHVWDFSGVSPEIGEPVPAPGDRTTHMKYYWEAGHFKKSLGDLAIGRILGAPGNFGIELTSHNVSSWLATDRQAIAALLESGTPLVTEVDSLILANHAP